MTDWDDIARDNLKAAQILADQRQFRSSASRAYYAAFPAVSFVLKRRAPFGKGRETPAHHMVTTLMQEHLAPSLTAAKLRDMKATIRRLYNERINADYKAGMTVDRLAALQSQRDAHSLCRELGVSHARRS